MNRARLLLVEDDPLVAETLSLKLEALGYQILDITERGETALKLVEAQRPDLVLMDIMLQGEMDGIETASTLSRLEIPVIFLTAHDAPELLERARITEPYGYILKPCDSRELHATVSMALYKAENESIRREQARLAGTLSSLSDALLVTDAAGQLIQANQAAERLLLTENALTGRPVEEVLCLADDGSTPRLEELLARVQQQPHPLEQDALLVRRDQSQLPVCLRLSALSSASKPSKSVLGEEVPGEGAHRGGAVILILDLSERYRQELELRLHAKVFESAQDGILITDEQSRILRVNRAFCAQSGYTAEQLIGHTPRRLSSRLQDPLFFRQLRGKLRQEGHWQGELWCRRADGEDYPALLHISTLYDAAGQPSHYVAMYTDLSRATSMQEQLYRVAHYDPQTQLPNRLLFQRQAEVLFANQEERPLRHELLVLDLCRFSAINESLGHLAGDQLLSLVAGRLRAILKDEHLLARIGSDSFAVLTSIDPDLPPKTSVADLLLQCFTSPYQIKGETLYLQANTGIAVYPDDGREVDVLLRKAHTACSHVTGNQGGFRYYSAALHQQLLAERQWERELREAVALNQLALYYQPQVDLRDGRIVGAEGLVRWQHPRKGLTGPDFFLPQAESCGLMPALGQWVLEEGCRQLRQWLDDGQPLAQLSLNLSVSQFEHRDFVATLERAVRQHAIPPGHLSLELVEHIALNRTSRTLERLRQIKALGVRLALDDFGTGYSSLLYLRNYPFDTIKIDRDFIASCQDSAEDEALLESIIDMGRKLGRTLVAEGVETEEQLHFLFIRACYIIQGFYYSAPLPARLFNQLLPHGFRHRRMLPEELYNEGLGWTGD